MHWSPYILQTERGTCCAGASIHMPAVSRLTAARRSPARRPPLMSRTLQLPSIQHRAWGGGDVRADGLRIRLAAGPLAPPPQRSAGRAAFRNPSLSARRLHSLRPHAGASAPTAAPAPRTAPASARLPVAPLPMPRPQPGNPLGRARSEFVLIYSPHSAAQAAPAATGPPPPSRQRYSGRICSGSMYHGRPDHGPHTVAVEVVTDQLKRGSLK